MSKLQATKQADTDIVLPKLLGYGHPKPAFWCSMLCLSGAVSTCPIPTFWCHCNCDSTKLAAPQLHCGRQFLQTAFPSRTVEAARAPPPSLSRPASAT